MAGRAETSSSAPTQLSHVERWTWSANCIHSAGVAFFGIDLMMWMSLGTAEPVIILWVSLEKPIFATSMMNAIMSLCFWSLLWMYSSIEAGIPSGVPMMFISSLFGQVGPTWLS